MIQLPCISFSASKFVLIVFTVSISDYLTQSILTFPTGSDTRYMTTIHDSKRLLVSKRMRVASKRIVLTVSISDYLTQSSLLAFPAGRDTRYMTTIHDSKRHQNACE
jgi:glutamine amidotransferase-like uncharacterized protein